MTKLGWISALLFLAQAAYFGLALTELPRLKSNSDQVHRMRCEDVRRSGSENDYFSCVSNAGTLTSDYASKIRWHWIGLGVFSALTLAGVAIGRRRKATA